jgi:hypothetical protein
MLVELSPDHKTVRVTFDVAGEKQVVEIEASEVSLLVNALMLASQQTAIVKRSKISNAPMAPALSAMHDIRRFEVAITPTSDILQSFEVGEISIGFKLPVGAAKRMIVELDRAVSAVSKTTGKH